MQSIKSSSIEFGREDGSLFLLPAIICLKIFLFEIDNENQRNQIFLDHCQ